MTKLQVPGNLLIEQVDKDFADEEKRFRNFENKVESLHKEAKGFLDSVRGTCLDSIYFKAMTLAQARIAETVDQFYDESAPLASAGRKYKEAVTTMDANARTQLVKLDNVSNLGRQL